VPVSKGRRKQKRKPTTRARVTQRAQAEAHVSASTSYRARRNRRVLAVSMMVIGAFVGVSHWIGHLGVFHVASPGVEDLLIGYPTALLLVVGGAMLLPAR
jgi:hypothetical protein